MNTRFDPPALTRRAFLRRAAVGMGTVGMLARPGRTAEVAELPFANGTRELVKYPQKRPLLRLTARPPQLETPMRLFTEAITPNDAFFVRYHLTKSPPERALLQPDTFKLSISGSVEKPLAFSVEELRSQFDPVEIVAVNQCSGNSRGFAQPRVPGGQSGNGMMGNARWKGVPLRVLLERAGLKRGARQVTFDGLDAPVLPQTPDYIKALEPGHALDGEVMLAYEMNGEPLPWLNGFPLRLVVPGYYGTYWVKHLHKIEVINEVHDGFWMNPAYRIPDNECACIPPGTKPDRTIPIERYNVRSFLTSLENGQEVKAGQRLELKGIAFDGGHGIQEVLVSTSGGETWKPAELGKDLGKYSFRTWQASFTPERKGEYELKVRAINRIGQSQPAEALWNPSGYMRNVIETTRIKAV